MRLPFAKRALPLVGYLVSTFNDQQTGIMQYLSKGADAYNFQALNGGKPTVTSSVLTRGTRDPFVLVGPNRSSFWMLATDLDIAKTSWGESQTHGSRSIVVWSSNDLVSWKQQAPVE
jgi:sucrose-6-phosphate hydrolase SacC (GH32 family)